MHPAPLLSFVALVLIFTPKVAAADPENKKQVKGIVGAIVNNSSRIGKEQRIAMEMACEDFNRSSNESLILYIRNSRREPMHAALAAMDLVDSQKVEAILGPQTWEETLSVAEIASNKEIPLLSFAEAIPNWATQKWPFLLQASPNQFAQMRAIAAILQSWAWHRVTVIYEDIDSSAAGVIPYLSSALREAEAEITNVLPLPPFPSSKLTNELEKLKSGQCRVFVVHLSFELAVHLFERAKKMEMMEEGYIWITTDAFTSLVHSIKTSTISSMQGILGVRSYFPENKPQFQDFYNRFRKRFRSEYPEEDNQDPGALAVQAYDAVWSVALAMKESKLGDQKLLQRILRTDFDGLTGKVQFADRSVAPARIYQIINVIGKSYRELGFWTNGQELGLFSEMINDPAIDNNSMQVLGQVLWPGSRPYSPKGWTPSESDKPLRIGVPIGSEFKQYVNFYHDEETNTSIFGGFSIELFQAAVEQLPFYLPYNLLNFSGSYDDLVKQIYIKNFDAVVGDVAIVAERCQYADFTHPYTESGLVMIVPVQKSSNKAFLFMKPFTKAMWILITMISIYNGFVVWVIERNHWPELHGSELQQTGTFLWLSFSSLISVHGEKLHSNLSRLVMVVWLFVTLVISQTYTANLTSMLTVQRLEPTVDNIDTLKNSAAIVGYSNVSYVLSYLVDVLQFNQRNLKGYTSPEGYVNDLKSRQIAAIFLDVAVAKIFLAKYCKGFSIAGPTYKVGGLGFVSENGKLQELETSMIASEKCMDEALDDDISSLSPSGFWVLFALTAGTSTIALLIYLSHCNWNINENLLVLRTRRMLVLFLLRQWRHQEQRFCRTVSNSESPGSSPNTSDEARFASDLNVENMA
ncbi:Glutamate receptor [Melia azedarach]|uniref:Glutamate receptor n=1 Tax=Melia azedarach TaxID=155640 RepID=A0ACC1YRP8_MELAZ|nr:Glutamate receptor [Melia azedarach]